MNPFAPPPAGSALPPEQVAPTYRLWRLRQLYGTFLGYAVYYFVRKNLSSAMPLMEKDLGIGKAQLGGFLTWHGIIYGISKFLNGMVGDRAYAPTFLAFGLLASAMCNLAFGFSSLPWVLGGLWVLNGWFQGMGFPPCARVLSHWFSPKERGVKWGLWNTSHMVGGFVIMILGGYLGQHLGWRAVFWVPAGLAILTSLFVGWRLVDTPSQLGLPPVEDFMGEDAPPPPPPAQPFWQTLQERVFNNPYIWFICFGNFFVYVVRYVFFDWWPTYLQQQRAFSPGEAGTLTASFELAGLVGSLVAGWWSDRWRRNSVCMVYLVATAAAITLYSQMPRLGFWQEGAAIAAVGFCIYGPQFLVGVMVTDLASKEAAASAIGLTGFFGYLSTVASGWGLGMLVESYGWQVSFQMTLGCTLAALFFFALCGGKKS